MRIRRLRRAIPSHVTYRGHFRAVRGFILLHLRRQWLSQAQLASRNHVNAHRIAQSRDFQFQGRVQRSRLGLPGLHVLKLKTQVDAAEVLVDVQHEKRRDHPAQGRRAVQFAHLHRFDMAHDARIVDPLDGMKLSRCPSFFLACHNDTLPVSKQPAFFPHTAASRFANAGCPSALAHWAGSRVWSARGAFLLALPLETRASPGGLPASGNSTPPNGLLNSMWRGSEKETARVPPSLDSPLSAAPETFLLRDAVSAFPIAFGPLPQSLPGARCLVSVALSRSLWRSFWNRARPLRGRASRPALSPAIDSQFRLPSIRPRHSCAYPADRPRERKTRARPDQAACSKLPSRPRPRPPAESPTLVRPPQSARTVHAPLSPSPQRSSAAPAPRRAPVRPGPDWSAFQRSISRLLLLSARPLPGWRRYTFRPALRAAIRAPLPTSPACAPHPSSLLITPTKSPNLPRPCRLRPCTAHSSTDPAVACDSSLPGSPGCPAHPRLPWPGSIPAAQSAGAACPAHPIPRSDRNSWFASKTSFLLGSCSASSPACLQSPTKPSSDKFAPFHRWCW